MFVPLTRLGQAELEGSISISFRRFLSIRLGSANGRYACNWFLLLF